MTGEDCSQPPLGVADTMLPNRSATSRWQVSPARWLDAVFGSGPLVRMVGSPVPGSSSRAGGSTSMTGDTLPSSPAPLNAR